MTLTRKRFLSVYAIVMIAVSANSAPKLRWTFETSRPTAPSWDVYRGETVLLQPTMLADGVAVEYAAGATATLWYQTNGMGAAWWSAPASVVSNIVSATWTPALDPGDDVTFFIGVSEGGSISYRANGSLSFLDAPGAVPNTLVLPELITAIDFDLITPVNAPWTTYEVVTNLIGTIEGGGGIDNELDPRAYPVATNALDIAQGAVPKTRTINGKALNSDVWLSAADVDAVGKMSGEVLVALYVRSTFPMSPMTSLEPGVLRLYRREDIATDFIEFDRDGIETSVAGSSNIYPWPLRTGGGTLALQEDIDSSLGGLASTNYVTTTVNAALESVVVDEADPLSIHTAGGTMTGPFKLAESGITFQGVNIETNFTFRAEYDGTNLNFNVYMEAK